MKYGICIYALIPARVEPSDKAEMVTQLIFGEHYHILEAQKKWLLIEKPLDGYQCWIDKKMHTILSKEDFDKLTAQDQKRCGDGIGFVTDDHGHRFAIPCSAILPGYTEGSFTINKHIYQFDGRIARHDLDSRVRHAKRLLHAPYLWGGKSIFGMDCSGFVQVVFNCAGISMPRDANQQASEGESVDFLDLAEPGDLVFFDNDEGRIIHVGILLSKESIIHASGSVRIDKVDHQGIFNEEEKAYTHQLRLIRRVKIQSV